jgi:hypothetical protein
MLGDFVVVTSLFLSSLNGCGGNRAQRNDPWLRDRDECDKPVRNFLTDPVTEW